MLKVLQNYALFKIMKQDKCRIQEVFTFCSLFSSNDPIFFFVCQITNLKLEKSTVDTST